MTPDEINQYVRDAESDISELKRKNKMLVAALHGLELAVNQSICGIKKVEISDWNALLSEAQRAMDYSK